MRPTIDPTLMTASAAALRRASQAAAAQGPTSPIAAAGGWAHVDGWDPDVVAAGQDLAEATPGVLFMPARSTVRRGHGALLDMLSVLGKDVTAGGAPRPGGSAAHDLVVAWLVAEQVLTVVLHGAQRWPAAAFEAAEAAVTAAGARLAVVTFSTVETVLQRELRRRHGRPVTPGELFDQLSRNAVQRQGASAPASNPAPPGDLRRLRRCRMPYVAAAYVLLTAADREVTPDELTGARVSGVNADGHRLVLPSGPVQVPAGCGRFLVAQAKYASSSAPRPMRRGGGALFWRAGQLMSSADIVFASVVAAREADLDFTPPSPLRAVSPPARR